MSRAWYAERFDRDYLDFYAHRDDAEAGRVTERILAPLGLAGRRVLDLACGSGRYMQRVEQQGARVVGLDLSAALLSAGRVQAPGRALVRGDMRSLPFRSGSFDVVLSMFTSFGYFAAAEEDRAVFGEVRRILAAGGRLVFDFLNAELLRAGLIPVSERKTNLGLVHERRWVDEARDVVIKEMRLESSPEWRREEVRLWDEARLSAALRVTGFDLEARYGDYDGGVFDAARSPRLLLIARRAARRVRLATRESWDRLDWGGRPGRDAASGRLDPALAPPGIGALARPRGPAGTAHELIAAHVAAPTPHRERWRTLLDPRAAVVVTGQQPGCAGGPLMVLYKAATAVALARRAARALDRPVVPVFWNAADDVDFEEIARVGWPNSAGEVASLELPRTDRAAQGFVGDLAASGDAAALHAALARQPAVPGIEWPQEPKDHGDWVGDFLARVFPELVLLDARDAAVRRCGASLFTRYLDRWEECGAALAAAASRLEQAGFEPALSPESTAIGLYLVDGRRRVKSRDRDVLRAALAANPEAVGPNVILRPLLQDTLLPTVAHVVGPAELHYLMQLRDLRRVLDVHEPALVPRLTATVVDRAACRAIRGARLASLDWLSDPEAAIMAAAREQAQPVLAGLAAHFERLRFEDLGIEPRVLDRARKRLEPVRAELEAAVLASARTHLHASQPRLEHVPGLVRPRGRAQERWLAGAWLYARAGNELGEFLVDTALLHLDDLDRGTPSHAVLQLVTA